MGTPPRVIVLGAGLAGLAAALRLAETGYNVEVIERRAAPGGRASSFVPPGETEAIDNCQHVLLGCCTNLLDFYRRAGTAHLIRFYSSFLFAGPKGLSVVSASALPAPLHLAADLVRFRDLNWADRWAIGRGMWAILRSGQGGDEPFGEWLRRHRQTRGAVENFWRVILTSALNEDLERLPCGPAFQVFQESFLWNRRGYRMGVPCVPLGELYSEKMLGGRCRMTLGASTACLEASESGAGEKKIGAVRLQDGQAREAEYFISGLPPESLMRLVPEEMRASWPEAERWRSFEWSPITGVHLWFDRPVIEHHSVAVLGRVVQWVFNRTAIGGKNGERGARQYLQLVISASRSLMPLKSEEIVQLCVQDLQEMFPGCREAEVVKAVVVKEARATVSVQPGTEALRPGAATPFANLFLAGDWTASGWPPTMEGAVRSGYRAAELVTEAAGEPRKFLEPDLPADPLVRLLRRL